MTGKAEITRWAKVYKERSAGEFRQSEKFGTATAFLHYTQFDGAPSESRYATWEWTRSAKEMAGYLRHVAIPMALANCMEVEAWDEDEGRPRSIEELLGVAAADADHDADVKAMRKVLKVLEAAKTANSEELNRVLVRATKAFSAHFGKGHWSNVTLAYYPDLLSAGTALFKQQASEDEEDGLFFMDEPVTKREWLDACRSAATKRGVRAHVIRVFEDATEV